jgi:hypothetical protein
MAKYAVIKLTVPTEWLVDTCAGGSWSRNERRACGFDSYPEAVDAVRAADIERGDTLGISWDVIMLSTEWNDPGVKF